MHVEEETKPLKRAEGTSTDENQIERLMKTHLQEVYVFLYQSQGTIVHETEVNISESRTKKSQNSLCLLFSPRSSELCDSFLF